jgi:hypothetical protein
MDTKELIRAAVAGKGEQPGWNSLSAQYQPMGRAIGRMDLLNEDLDRDRLIARRRSWLPFDWYSRRGIRYRINTEPRRPTTAENVAVRTEFGHSGGIRS